MHVPRKIFASICLLATVSCATPKQTVCPEDSPVVKTVVPFELIDNRIFVDVMIDGQGPFKFIFDTGSTNVLTPLVAQKLNLKLERDSDGTGAGENSFRVDKTKINDLGIGDVHLQRQNFRVIDLASIQKAFNLPALDGAFGYEVLLQYLVEVNFEQEQLTISKDHRAFDRPTYEKIPFVTRVDKPMISANINGLPAKILVDTGDRSALTVFRNFREQHKTIADIYSNSKTRLTGVGGGGPIPAKLGTIANLQLAPKISLEKVISRAPTTKNGFNALEEMNASIGNEILKQFNVTFDYKNANIYLEPNRHFGEPIKFTEVPNPNLK